MHLTDTIVSASAMRLLQTHSPRHYLLRRKTRAIDTPIDPKAAALGHRFFFDTAFSGALSTKTTRVTRTRWASSAKRARWRARAATSPKRHFDNRSTRAQVSLAAGWGVRRTRHLLDIGQAAKSIIMWDGLHDALYNQPFQPIENAPEMNSSRLFVAEQIFKKYRARYEEVFGVIPDPARRRHTFSGADTPRPPVRRKLLPGGVGKDCHGMPGDKAEYDGLSAADQDAVTRVAVNFGKALGADERRPYLRPRQIDKWVHGQSDALTPSEQRGAALFIGQRPSGATGGTNCNSCHTGPFFTDQAFHNVGLRPTGVGPAGSFLDTDDHGAQHGLAKLLKDPLNTRGKNTAMATMAASPPRCRRGLTVRSAPHRCAA